MDTQMQARLLNAGGELIAEGPCWLNEAVGQATLEPEREAGLLEKQHGDLTLELETGRRLRVSDRPLIFRLRPRGNGADHSGRRRLYRLWLTERAHDATEAGAAEDGAPASRQGETPAAN